MLLKRLKKCCGEFSSYSVIGPPSKSRTEDCQPKVMIAPPMLNCSRKIELL